MLETRQSLLPKIPDEAKRLNALCVGIEDESLKELERLLTTLDLHCVESHKVKLRQISPATYLQRGKIEELALRAKELDCHAVAFDFELSPNQLKNLEKALGFHVLDRPGAIIEIFSAHARTKEAKTQVEIARLKYLLPRLAHFWTHFERQRGGIGLKGMGEKQIEVDRRLVKDRMARLKERLKSIQNERKLHRERRKDLRQAAIVGYTNAGKSTLLNAMTHANVRAEDKLFATLDASYRALDPHSHPPVVAIDTVGFIRNLPPDLIASFRSTLEVIKEADLWVHVVDAGSSRAKEEIQVTEDVLSDLMNGDEAPPRILIFNKMDLASPAKKLEIKALAAKLLRDQGVKSLFGSALDLKSVKAIREAILEQFRGQLESWEIVIPYGNGKIESQIRAHGYIEKSNFLEKGTFYKVKMARDVALKLGLQKYRS